MEVENKNIDSMIKWYVEHQENLSLIGKKSRGKWKVKPEAKIMHDLTDEEMKQFQEGMNKALKEQEEKFNVGGKNERIDETLT